MQDQETFSQFTDVLKKQLDVVNQLTEVERTLTDAASTQDTAKLRASVQDAEPVLLSFRGLEMRRKKLQDAEPVLLSFRGLEMRRKKLAQALGFGDLSFSEILNRVSDEDREILEPLFTDLVEALGRLKSLEESTNRIMTIRLRDIGETLRQNPGVVPIKETRA